MLRQKTPLFANLTDAEVHLLMHRAEERVFAPGELIFAEGSLSQRFSLIWEGEVEIIKSLGTPSERLINVIGVGEVLGEMSLLQGEHRRTASGRALTPVRLLDIHEEDFTELVRGKPELAYGLMEIITRRLGATENAVISDLIEKNEQLENSLRELQEAQAQLLAKERLENELAVARHIQESMLPDSLPDLPGWRMAARWRPAHAVSGDFYDFIPLPDGRIALVVGDVTDKGMPAALIMTVTRSLMRAAAVQSTSPGELLARVNNLLCPDMPDSMFVTCHVTYLDPRTGRIEYANAGHCLPLWCHDSQMIDVQARGLPLGLMPDMPYQGGMIQVEPGDRLLYYSDGLIEAHAPDGKMLGLNAIKALLAQESGEHCMSGGQLIDFLLSHLENFRGALEEQEDDITILYLERAA